MSIVDEKWEGRRGFSPGLGLTAVDIRSDKGLWVASASPRTSRAILAVPALVRALRTIYADAQRADDDPEYANDTERLVGFADSVSHVARAALREAGVDDV